MRSVKVIILLTFIAQGHAKKTVANHTTDEKDTLERTSKLAIGSTWNLASMSKTGMLSDKLVGKLVDRSLKVWALRDLDDTILASSFAVAPQDVVLTSSLASGKAFRRRWGLESRSNVGVMKAPLSVIGACLGVVGLQLGMFGAGLGVVESSADLVESKLGALGNRLKDLGRGLKASKDSGEDSIGVIQRLVEMQQQLERECLEKEELAANARSQAEAAVATAEVAQAAEAAARSELLPSDSDGSITNAAAAAAARAAAEWVVAESAAAASATERWAIAAQEAERLRAETAAAAREVAAATALQAEVRKEQWEVAESMAAKTAEAEVRGEAFRAAESASAASAAAESAAAAELAREIQLADTAAAVNSAERWKTAAEEAEAALETAAAAAAKAMAAAAPLSIVRNQRSLPATGGAAGAVGAVEKWAAVAQEAEAAQTESAAVAAVATLAAGGRKPSPRLNLVPRLRAVQPSAGALSSNIPDVISVFAAALIFLFVGSGVTFAVLRVHSQTSQTVVASLLEH